MPITRLMLFIEEWLYRCAKWVACEANDQPLWVRRLADANLGIVNMDVGLAPLNPAEFIMITIHQIAGESDLLKAAVSNVNDREGRENNRTSRSSVESRTPTKSEMS